jgi:hypothetical protein
MDLAVLLEDDAVALLPIAAEPERLDAEPAGPAGELNLLCGRVPLALRITGDHLATHLFTRVTDLVDELTEECREARAESTSRSSSCVSIASAADTSAVAPASSRSNSMAATTASTGSAMKSVIGVTFKIKLQPLNLQSRLFCGCQGL